MDRRQQKSRKAIFDAFNTLLEKKSYNSITVQEIIDEANVGRTTFYAHFETKDILLKEMCEEIFGHVFSNHLEIEKTHNFSGVSHTLEEQITHLLYHIKDNSGHIKGLLSCEENGLFLHYFEEYVDVLFSKYPDCLILDIPQDLAIHLMTVCFYQMIHWWIEKGMKESPEQICGYYLKTIHHE